mgnify:CR=1 FL=1
MSHSTIPGAGSGVFAGRTGLKAGEWCCAYNGFITSQIANFDDFRYSVQVRPREFLIGKRPAVEDRDTEGCSIAQIQNDAGHIELTHPTRLSSALDAVRNYQSVSEERENTHTGDGFQFTAARDIVAGAEIFTSYGLQYWLNSVFFGATSPSISLLAFLAKDIAMSAETRPKNPHLFRYDPAAERITRRGQPLTEEDAAEFISYIGLHNGSSFWDQFHPASGHVTALDRVKALLEHFVFADGESFDYTFNGADPGTEHQASLL